MDALGGRDGMVGGDTEVEGALCGGVPVWWVLSFGGPLIKEDFYALIILIIVNKKKIEKSL